MSALNNLKLHYFTTVKDSTTKGRGENIRLLLEDAGVDFEYVKHTFPEWFEMKKELLAQGVIAPSLPFITVDGKQYHKTAPIMRFISKKLGKYEGADDDENQLLDAYTDVIMDWATKWVSIVFGDSEEATQTYRSGYVTEAHKSWNTILSNNTSGPYILGDRITYADFALFHILEDDNNAKIDAEQYPHLAAFVKAIQARPNLSKYLATDRK